ncbi:MAG: tyrosine-type recombinase/integrase, partial [Phycisphaerae bacterium]
QKKPATDCQPRTTRRRSPAHHKNTHSKNRAGHYWLSPRSCNDYLANLRQFVGWLVKAGRVGVDPLGSIERVDMSRREQYRRAFTPDELRRLLAVAGDRAVAYLVAALTGLRRKELGALRWDDVILGVGSAYIVVRASIAKNARRARIDLHPDVAATLTAWRSRSTGPLVFGAAGLPDVATLKADLAAAGIAFKDESGRRLDFHSFRGTFATMLAAVLAPVPLTQQLMRHSDYKMTLGYYIDGGQFSAAAVLQCLPRFSVGIAPNFCNLSPPPTGQKQSFAVSSRPNGKDEQTLSSGGDCHVLTPGVTKSHNGAETASARTGSQSTVVVTRWWVGGIGSATGLSSGALGGRCVIERGGALIRISLNYAPLPHKW